MKICICGGGNLAHAFAGDIGLQNDNIEINILTRQPEKWDDKISVYYDMEFHHIRNIKTITNSYEILKKMDIVILTIPAHARYSYLEEIKNYIPKNALLISAPSIGGINYLFDKFFPNNKYICCQRVPYICRTIEYGHKVNTDVKKCISAFFSKNCTLNEKKLIATLLNMQVVEMETPFPLFLSNSNPILHIAGMCEILNKEYPLDYIPKLYDTWSDYASNLAIGMDQELSLVMEKLDVKDYSTLLEYYGVNNSNELTQKLKSIKSFEQVFAPLIKDGDKYVIDNNSRYIIEDLPYGTCFIKLFAEKNNIKTPTINYCLDKLQQFYKVKLIDNDGKLNIDNLSSQIEYINECIK